MKPIDFRNETFEQLRGRLSGLRERVWIAWLAFSPGTTRAVAIQAKMDILTFRPRTTELLQMGALRLAADQPGGTEGVYEFVSNDDWIAWHQRQRADLVERQLQLV